VEDDQEELLPKLEEPELLEPPPPNLPANAIESEMIAINRKNMAIWLRALKACFLVMRKTPSF
jgi:hypothetical protein